ncbi:myo-inositol 2-dehydrogenase [Actinomadura sp. NBRC 104412]|uniref:Gfo/Idh/MocA family protein n=1 Tax=Actinomadura sp. NBRC 104412 TaxID=3032203 RepID=UPI0024A2A2A6|nr:Gfo/Idh/MocA family oxidoreductase [Actinomadura sp. NBRC 104412]GLZ06147.1 myo-inositol 2-dehydrogenase [Actinomadura sp. NBRC 104412]
MGKLRLGVIGAGSWAVAAHLPALAERGEEIEFTGVCRKGGEALRRIKDRYGFRVASEDYRDVLDAGVDICVVASPTALHHEQVRAALEAGAHVLCEKPMTIRPEDAWDLVETARRAERELLISFGWNYSPMIRAARRLVDEHGLGRLEHLTVHMSSQTRELLSNTGAYPDADPDTVPEPATWTDPRVSGGGYGQAQLSHALGLALHLVPERVECAFALMSAPGKAPVELHDAIALRFTGGGVGTLSGGSAHLGAGDNKHALEVRAIGSEGQLLVDVERELVWLYRPDGTDIRLPVSPGDGAYQPWGPANALVDAALGHAGANAAPGDLGARTVEALDLAYRSARSGRLEARS